MKTKGFFWHIHHDILVEWSDNIEERIDYIKKNKPSNQVETRLRLIKPVKGKLPDKFVKAREAYEKATKFQHKVWKACEKARKVYNRDIEEIHKKECGCKEWKWNADYF